MTTLLPLLTALVATDPTPAGPVPLPDATQFQDLEERVRRMEERNEELERRIGLLSEELEQTALGDAYVPVGEGFRGLSPAASKIYGASSPLSIGGYGEAVYDNFQGSGTDEADFLRAVLYFGYRFNDKWLLNTEFEFEHASTSGGVDGDGGSVSLEFGYLEYFATENTSLRFGLLLVPLGFVNELHEPTLFPSVNRPFIEQRIVPSTFRENGLGFAGENEEIAYRAYLINGLDAEGFSASGLRGGRQRGSEADAEDLSVVGRLDYVGTEGLLTGVGLYHGNSGQDSGAGSVQTTLLDLHAEYNWNGWRGRFLGLWAELDDVEQLNALFESQDVDNTFDAATGDTVGEELWGYYLELQYNVFNASSESSELLPFVRYERFDTQAEVPVGTVGDGANDQEIWNFGLAYKPHPNIVFKADYVDIDTAAGAGRDIFRLGMGYIF